MHRTALLILAALIGPAPAIAQPPSPPPKPYEPVAITHAAAFEDASFVAFRATLAAAANSRIYAELARLMPVQGFFWDRDFRRRFDARKPAVDNLALAIELERRDGIGWKALAVFAAEAAVEPLDSRPGVICAPARPGYDGVAFAKLLDTSYTAGVDWAYPRADSTPVRAAPQPDADLAGTLGLHFVRVLRFEGADNDPVSRRTQWTRVVMPDGTARICRPRQPDVADRRTALLHQGLGRRLADRRIHRRGRMKSGG